MKHQLIAGLCFAIVVAMFARDHSYNVKYEVGSLSNTKAGAELKMYIDANQVRFVKDNAELAKIPASAIIEIIYEQDVSHSGLGTHDAVFGSGGLTALSRSRHSVGLTWASGDQKVGLALQCDKNDYRDVVAGLEGISRKKAVNSGPMTLKN